MSQIIEEAFKELKSLKEETFSFDKQGALELQRFLDKSREGDTDVTVVDPDAETEENLKKDYSGEVILSCDICNGLIPKDPKDVILDSETNLANVEEECPYCLNKGGYKVVAQIPGYDRDGDAIEREDTPEEDEDADISVEVDNVEFEEGEGLEESLNEADDSGEEGESRYEEGYIVIYSDDPENFDESKNYYEIYDTEDEAIDSIDLEGTGYSYALVDTESGSGNGRIFTSGADDEIEEIIEAEADDSEEEVDDSGEEVEDEDVPLIEAKEASDTDLWSEIYGKLTSDGEQIISKNGSPRINRGAGYGNQEEVTTNRDGDIVVRCSSEAELEPAKAVAKSYADRGVTAEVKYDRYMKKPYSLIIKVPENEVSESLDEEGEAGELVAADVVLEPKDLDAFDTNTLQITLTYDASDRLLDSDFKHSKEINIGLSGQPDRVYTYKIGKSGSDGKVQLEYVSAHRALTEAVEDISVKTSDDIINVRPDENGGVTVEAQPREIEAGTLEPVSPEVQTEIENNTDSESGEDEESDNAGATEETGDENVDIEEFEEGDFDQLGEAYLKNIYDNVKSFATTRGYLDNDRIKLEGLITFNSGKTAKTSFVFESYRITKRGKLKFLGENLQITPRKNSFILTGSLQGKKLIAESLTYNYTAKDAATGESKRVYGTVNKKK